MKKLLILCIALISVIYEAQYSTSDEMQILNYSKYTMGGHVSARSDNCTPALRGEFSDNIYPNGDPLGRNATFYRKFNNTQTAPVPINQWIIVTTSAGTFFPLTPNNALLDNPFGTQARWGGMEVEYWLAGGPPLSPNGGFAVNYDVRAQLNPCSTYPMTYTDPNVTVTSFYLPGTDDYIVIIV